MIIRTLLIFAILSFPCYAQKWQEGQPDAPHIKAQQELALRQIQTFTDDMKAADPRYADIEKKLMPVIGDVVRDYPPQYWLGIIKLLYQVRAIP